ncbi:preprotein translocase subunit SecA [compost metagenome]
MELQRREEAERLAAQQQLSHYEENSLVTEDSNAPASAERKVGRNDLCPCGSGKKYKQCHGRLQK